MKKPESIREAGAMLRRRLPQRSPREHRVVRALVGLLIVLGMIALVSSVSGANGYRARRPASPVRSVAKPISSYQNFQGDLIDVPNPMDSSTNQVITGNVAAGKHFRGAVPYSSPTSIKTPLGSRSLDSFMRYSTPPAASDRISGPYSPYYSSTGTVAAIEPGRRSTASPGGSPAAPDYLNQRGDAAEDSPRLGIWSNTQAAQGPGLTLGEAALEASRRLRGLSSPEEIEDGHSVGARERFTERGIPSPADQPMTGEAYKQQVQELQDRLGKVVAEIAELERGLEEGQGPEPLEIPKLTSNVSTPAPETPSSLAANISRREELLQETARLLAATKETIHRDGIAPLRDEESPAPDTSAGPRLRLYQSDASASESAGTASAAEGSRIDALFLPVAKDKPEVGRPDALAVQPFDRPMGPIAGQWSNPDPAASTAVKTIRTPPAEATVAKPAPKSSALSTPVGLSPESLQAFERYLQAGQAYLKQGQYRRAADSFALAAAYKPNDPRVHLGKSQALLAAGEFASSAFFLGKAVELDAKYALAKSDLIEIAGGPDAFIARFGQLSEAAEADGTAQLQFLLAYVYYQSDRPAEAKTAIEAASKKLPSSASVASLRAAINSR